MLEVQAISKRFGGLLAVNQVSLSVRQGEIAGLIGPNGAGKTTLFNLITGWLPADGGSISLRGKPITGQPPHLLTRRGIARTFQTPRGLPGMTVLENLTFVPAQIGESILSLFTRRSAVRSEEDAIREQALKVLASVGLAGRAGEYVMNLSAGELKILELARQLMLNPEVLLLDEPASGVNPGLLEGMVHLIQRLRAQGMTCLIIDHNLGFITRICDQIHVLAQGELIASGPPESMMRHPKVIEVYLGGSE